MLIELPVLKFQEIDLLYKGIESLVSLCSHRWTHPAGLNGFSASNALCRYALELSNLPKLSLNDFLVLEVSVTVNQDVAFTVLHLLLLNVSGNICRKGDPPAVVKD